MKKRIFPALCILCMALITMNSFAQDTPPKKRSASVKKIWDIPHETLWEKWMWPHRSATFIITKERPIDYDTAYIKSYKKRLGVTVPLSTRFLTFTLQDGKGGSSLLFSPNLHYNIGLSITSRWASFILNSGVKIYGGNKERKGETKFQDFQLNLYGRKVTTDTYFQYYSGFYIRNSKSFENYQSDSAFAIRPDVNVMHMGISTYYIVNNKKFSYRSSFAFAEQQRKSAGSLLMGVYYSYFDASGDPSLISSPFRSSFDSLSYIKNARAQDFGFNIGYIYTFVFLKKCSATISLVQGIGGQHLHYLREDYTSYNKLLGGAEKIHARAALKYDNDRLYIGAMGILDYVLLPLKSSNSSFDYTYGKAMVFVGYRFKTLKKENNILKKMKLIGY